MMRIVFLAAAVLCAPLAIAAPPSAEVDCKSTGEDFVYDCTIRLSRDGRPLTGVEVSVGADMPSMPMAHNVRPAKATPGDKPGEYRARIELEMQGEWALKLRLSGAVRDLIVVKRQFGDQGSGHAEHRMQMK
ncbi:MAG: FixH family protein [Burkholderiales bacterium]|nr:FixH family protein [Burkholderiales bacterium]